MGSCQAVGWGVVWSRPEDPDPVLCVTVWSCVFVVGGVTVSVGHFYMFRICVFVCGGLTSVSLFVCVKSHVPFHVFECYRHYVSRGTRGSRPT